MLNSLREAAKSGIMKFVLLGIMGLAGGGLVLMDVGGFFRGGVNRTSIARIGNNELPIQSFDRTVRRVLASNGLDVETAYKLGFINQILQGEISGNVMQRAALDLGLEVGDDTVIAQINKLIEPLVSPEMDKKAALSTVLRQQGLTEQDFARMIRAEISNALVRNAIQIGTEVPPGPLAIDLYQHGKEQRTANIIVLPHSGITDVEQPVEEILISFYQAGKENYAVPETRTFSIAILSQDNLEKTTDIADEELKTIYERDIATYSVPERRQLEQSVVDDQAKAAAIAEALGQGKSMKEAVTAATGSEDAYLGDNKFEQAGLPKEIGEPIFKAEPGATVGPVQTALGWHVIKVKSIIPPETRPFEEVKADLKKEILQMRVADDMFETGNQIDDRLAGGAALEEVAQEMGLKISTYGPVKEDGSTVDSKDGLKDFGPDWGSVVTTVFGLNEGESAPVMELADGRIAVIRLDKAAEKTYRPFEEVKDELSKTWIQDQKEVANKLRAEDALKALNASEKTLNDIAAANGASVQTVTMTRDEDAKEPMNQPAKTLFFTLDENEPGMAPAKDGYILGIVTGVKLPDPKKISEADKKSFTEIAQQGEQGEFMQIYFKHLQSAYNVKINQRLLDQTYGPGNSVQ